MQWQDKGLVLSVKRHGENNALLEVFTPKYGLHRGYVKGGAGRRKRADLQPGNLLNLTWRSRIEENLGSFTHEAIHSPLGTILSDPKRLAALSSMCSTLSAALAERQAHPRLFEGFAAFVEVLEHDEADIKTIASSMVRVEAGVLKEIGFGLDLTACTVSGQLNDLAYVSPKSGRAVSLNEGKAYHDKLLLLPKFMWQSSDTITLEDCISGIELTGFFLKRHVWDVAGKDIPQARQRFLQYLRQ